MKDIPPLRYLRAFEAATRRKCFSDAAAEIGVSPGTVARRVELLEGFLNAELFVRRSNGVSLTREGCRYALMVAEFLDDVAVVETDRPEKWRLLIVSTLNVFHDRWLARRLPAFLEGRKHTSVQLEFHDGVNGILTPGPDIWILYSSGNHPGCRVTRLFGEDLVPVVSPELRQTLPAHPKPEDVARLPLLHDIGWIEDWPLWAEAMGHAGADLSPGQHFALYGDLIRCSIAGGGVAMGHTSMIGGELASGRLAAIDGMAFPSPKAFHMVVTPSAPQTQPARELREWIESQAPVRTPGYAASVPVPGRD